MAKRFFTADWHLNDANMLTIYNRPFINCYEMNNLLIDNANQEVSFEDTLIHVGDFMFYNPPKNENETIIKTNPSKFVEKINGTFINIEGNHDPTNKTKSVGWFLQTKLGPFSGVSVAHYPSYHSRVRDLMKPGWIHLCGHVHDKWKYYIDKDRQVLNINVGVDVWDYKPISDEEIIAYIKNLIKRTAMGKKFFEKKS